MGVRFCPYCGRPVVANSSFCASCGAALGTVPPAAAPTGTPAPLTFPTAVPYSPYPTAYPATAMGAPSFGATDRFALSSVSLAAILGLVGAVLSFFTIVFTPAFSFIGVSTTGSGSSVSVDQSALYLLVAVGGGGLILALLELWFYRQAFRTLARQDGRFTTPASLTLLALVALVIIVVVSLALIAVIYQSVVCAGSGNAITSTCVNFGELLGLVAVLGITAIVLLVGYIGLLIGIWRLGTRYDDGKFKAGAILLIFPLLNIVGLILILVAARSASEKVGNVTSPLQFR